MRSILMFSPPCRLEHFCSILRLYRTFLFLSICF
nr:MAG TPA: hypothetical protein [Caudoviricetes sp.]